MKMRVGKSVKKVIFRFRRRNNGKKDDNDKKLPISKEEKEDTSWPLDEIDEDFNKSICSRPSNTSNDNDNNKSSSNSRSTDEALVSDDIAKLQVAIDEDHGSISTCGLNRSRSFRQKLQQAIVRVGSRKEKKTTKAEADDTAKAAGLRFEEANVGGNTNADDDDNDSGKNKVYSDDVIGIGDDDHAEGKTKSTKAEQSSTKNDIKDTKQINDDDDDDAFEFFECPKSFCLEIKKSYLNAMNCIVCDFMLDEPELKMVDFDHMEENATENIKKRDPDELSDADVEDYGSIPTVDEVIDVFKQAFTFDSTEDETKEEKDGKVLKNKKKEVEVKTIEKENESMVLKQQQKEKEGKEVRTEKESKELKKETELEAKELQTEKEDKEIGDSKSDGKTLNDKGTKLDNADAYEAEEKKEEEKGHDHGQEEEKVDYDKKIPSMEVENGVSDGGKPVFDFVTCNLLQQQLAEAYATFFASFGAATSSTAAAVGDNNNGNVVVTTPLPPKQHIVPGVAPANPRKSAMDEKDVAPLANSGDGFIYLLPEQEEKVDIPFDEVINSNDVSVPTDYTSLDEVDVNKSNDGNVQNAYPLASVASF